MAVRRILLSVSLALAGSSSLALEPLRLLGLDSRTMPLGLVQRDGHGKSVLVDGIAKDWLAALASELGREAVHVLLPRQRQDAAVAERLADLRCFISPDWLSPEQARLYDWPEPFMELEERLVGAADGTLVATLEELAGKTVGTVLGYRYRSLEPLFEQGLVKRDIAPNEASLLLKQLARRTDFAVMRSLDFQYLHKHDARFKGLSLMPAVISRISLYCARPKTSPISLQALSAAQERLFKARTLEGILSRYR